MPNRLSLLCFLLLAATPPARALEKSVVLDNVVLRSGDVRAEIPSLTLEETPLAAAEARRLFDAADAAPLAERVSRFSVARTHSPEIRGEAGAGERRKHFIYRDATLEDAKAGRIGALRIAKLEEALDDKGASVVATYTNLSAKSLDLPAWAALFAAPRANDAEPAKPVLGEAHLDKIDVEAKDGALALHAGPLEATDMRLRAFSAPTLAALSRPEGPLAEDAAAALGLIDSLEFGALEARNFNLSGRDGATGKARSLGARRLAAKGFGAGLLREAAIDGFALESADGGKLAADGLSLRGLDVVRALREKGPRAWRFDHAALTKASGDMPDPDGGRTKFSLASADLDLADFHEGIPAKAAFRLQSFNVDLASRGEDASAGKILRSLGYAALEFSGAGAAEWREATRELELSQLRLDAKDMGALSLSAKFSGVDPGVFNPNPLIAGSLLLAARLNRLEATLEGGELLNRLLAAEAKTSGGDPAKVRAEYADNLAQLVLAQLGEDAKAQRIAAAIRAYVLHPKKLRIVFVAPKGFGATDLIKSFPEILQEIDVEASAE